MLEQSLIVSSPWVSRAGCHLEVLLFSITLPERQLIVISNMPDVAVLVVHVSCVKCNPKTSRPYYNGWDLWMA